MIRGPLTLPNATNSQARNRLQPMRMLTTWAMMIFLGAISRVLLDDGTVMAQHTQRCTLPRQARFWQREKTASTLKLYITLMLPRTHALWGLAVRTCRIARRKLL